MIRKTFVIYGAKHPDVYWTSFLPYFLLASRMVVSTTTLLPPFTIVTGRTPALPSHLPQVSIAALAEELSEARLEAYAELIIQQTDAIASQVQRRLSRVNRLRGAANLRLERKCCGGGATMHPDQSARCGVG